MSSLPSTVQAVINKAKRENWPSRPRQGKGGGVEYPLTALPADTQRELEKRRIAALVGEDMDTAAYGQAQKLRLTPAELDDPEVAKKLRCHRLVTGCIPWAKPTRSEIKAQLAAEYGVASLTIHRWVQDVETWMLRTKTPSIVMGDADIKMPTARGFDDDALKYGIQVYANNLKAGKKAAYQKLQAKAQENGWKIADYSNFTRAVNKLPEALWDYIRKGKVGFELKHIPKITRAWLQVPTYSVVCGDQNVLDYVVVDESTGELLTMNLYLWMDCTSRAWTGMWPAFGSYNSYTVGASLREALRLGLPDSIFTDWGKPEISKQGKAMRDRLAIHCGVGDWEDFGRQFGAIGDELIEHRKAPAGVPWAKPIENQMNILKRALLDRDVPGFRQRLSGEWENDQRQEELAALKKKGGLLTTQQMLEVLLQVFKAHNDNTCRIKENGALIVPGQVLAGGLQQQNRTVLDEVALDLVCLPAVERHVRQSMIEITVRGDKRVYWAPEFAQLNNHRERVTVHYDPFDPLRPATVTLNGQFLCLAERHTNVNPVTRDGLDEKLKRQAEQMKWWGAQVRTIQGKAAGVVQMGAASQAAQAAKRAEANREIVKSAAKRGDDKIIELAERKRKSL